MRKRTNKVLKSGNKISLSDGSELRVIANGERVFRAKLCGRKHFKKAPGEIEINGIVFNTKLINKKEIFGKVAENQEV